MEEVGLWRGKKQQSVTEAKLGDCEAQRERESWKNPQASLSLQLCPINTAGAQYIQWSFTGASGLVFTAPSTATMHQAKPSNDKDLLLDQTLARVL